jgi:hypothetical protein
MLQYSGMAIQEIGFPFGLLQHPQFGFNPQLNLLSHAHNNFLGFSSDIPYHIQP